MNLSRLATSLVTVTAVLVLVLPTSRSVAQESLRPSDPIAAIDGDPILLGELNYLLASKLKVKDLSDVNLDVQRASSALLVRQHMALQTLRQQGGTDLQTLLDRDWEEFLVALRRKGLNLDEYCKQFQSDERSVRQSHDWDSAWRRYLKSMMTDANLKRYYELHHENYSSARWNVSHLFIAVDKQSRDSQAIAEQRIQDITSQLQETSDAAEALKTKFAELAVRESEGATADKGGGIGWVSQPGDLPTAVMKAIRETETGSVTPPVLSPLGYHLVLVHEKKVERVAYEDVSDLTPLRRDAATALFDALVARHGKAKVVWYVKQLQPPGN
ncbi:Foldase protein PrsA precursor [Stieleria maiorica]|uniref:Foldase protein PrsA n=1 Tax=Stieleria maiorica TaxID=2795974 RepID=A0A5B9MCE3_9BACT|nr:peptidylprolyl isomerase [Stieleria maiorica]QEF98991.1 Foldase protein PrsA precursor [Stieleria maiorica]